MSFEALYKDYVSEREGGREIISDENSFISYRIVSKDELYIVDMFIKREARRSSKGRELIEKVSAIAKDQGCRCVTGVIRLNDPGASNTMLGALMVGFRIVAANDTSIFIAKELGE